MTVTLPASGVTVNVDFDPAEICARYAEGQSYEADCIIFATGFEADISTADCFGYEIAGRNELRLSDYFAKGAGGDSIAARPVNAAAQPGGLPIETPPSSRRCVDRLNLVSTRQ
jgi:hypothetical protein